MNFFNAKRLVIGVLFLAQGCITPINMAYDNASPLAKSEFSISGGYSVSDDATMLNTTDFVAEDYMMRLGCGLDGKTSMYMSYHHRESNNYHRQDFFNLDDERFYNYDFCDLKFRRMKNRILRLR